MVETTTPKSEGRAVGVAVIPDGGGPKTLKQLDGLIRERLSRCSCQCSYFVLDIIARFR